MVMIEQREATKAGVKAVDGTIDSITTATIFSYCNPNPCGETAKEQWPTDNNFIFLRERNLRSINNVCVSARWVSLHAGTGVMVANQQKLDDQRIDDQRINDQRINDQKSAKYFDAKRSNGLMAKEFIAKGYIAKGCMAKGSMAKGLKALSASRLAGEWRLDHPVLQLGVGCYSALR
jgi:hypothetical protein